MARKYAGAAKVGEKGQIVIPKEVRDLFGIKPGDTLIVLADTRRGIAILPSGVMDRAAEHLFKGGIDIDGDKDE